MTGRANLTAEEREALCTCGRYYEHTYTCDLTAQKAERIVAAHKADAWDKGYRTGYSYRGPHGQGAGNPMPDNPYRAEVSS